MAELFDMKEIEERVILIAVSTDDEDDTRASLDELEELADMIENTALCGLGKSAPKPVISTMNAFEEEFHRIAEFAKSLGVDTVHVLPYHTLGESKYEMLGKAYTMGYEIKSLPRDEAEVFRQIVLSHGLNCVVGG